MRKYRKTKMMSSVNLLDVVILTVDLPEFGLACGQSGTVVGILAEGFEVEFNDDDGRTIESIGLRPDQIRSKDGQTKTAPEC